MPRDDFTRAQAVSDHDVDDDDDGVYVAALFCRVSKPGIMFSKPIILGVMPTDVLCFYTLGLVDFNVAFDMMRAQHTRAHSPGRVPFCVYKNRRIAYIVYNDDTRALNKQYTNNPLISYVYIYFIIST